MGAADYGKEYFEKYSGYFPYRWDEPHWLAFFDRIAEEIVARLKPRTVLDVGCGVGFLVEALRRRRVAAYGVDISEYAITQVPGQLQTYCRVASAVDPLPNDFPQSYDLTTCIEVLEHIPEEQAKDAVRLMAHRTSSVLFSSTPHDLEEPTHVNVRPVIYWLQLFGQMGFHPDLRFDASFVSPQAFLLRKNRPRLKEDTLPFFAEAIYRRLDLHAQQAEILRLTNAKEELQKRFEAEVWDRDKQIASLSAEIAQRAQTIAALNEGLRRESTERESLAREVSILQANALSEKEGERRGLEVRTLELDAKIHLMQEAQSGLFWELLSAYRRVKDRYCPPRTKRRQFYDLGLKSIKVLKNEGLGSFFSKSISKLRQLRTPLTATVMLGGRLRPSTFRPRQMLRMVGGALKILRMNGLGGFKQWFSDKVRETYEYQHWVKTYDSLADVDRVAIDQHISQLPYKPLISVVMPVYNTQGKWLRLAIESVRKQLYPDWELCIADDASSEPHVRRILEEYRAKDSRIKVVFREINGNISAASNSAIEIATGDFIALLDHDDELSEHALYMIAAELNDHPDADLIYSDEDKIGEENRRYDPYFKPDWNPALFLAQNFVRHLGVYRARIVTDVGGFRAGYEGSQDWDLALRVIERIPAAHIHHIPYILYHWRAIPGSAALAVDEKKYAREAQLKTLNSHFSRMGRNPTIVPVSDGYWRVRYPVPAPPPEVALIVATRDGLDLLRRCVESIYEKTAYPNFHLIIVDNQSNESSTLTYLGHLERDRGAKILRYDFPFNFAAINNVAVQNSEAEIIGLINNDLEVISPDWLGEMVSHAARPEVGAVGAMLYYPNNTVQHGGVVLGLGGVAGHAYTRRPRHYAGQASRALLCQDLSAVTAACLVLRREVYKEVGGMDEKHLTIAFNDVDLCLRIKEKGYRILWTPYAELYHYESASRGYEDTPDKQARFNTEANYMRQRWGKVLLSDPAYNPNLALDRESFMLSFPPRAKKPWHEAAAVKAV